MASFWSSRSLNTGTPPHSKRSINSRNEDVRNLVMNEFTGNIVRLISHAEAGMIVNDMYRDICTPAQKLDFLQELYGPEYRLFKVPRPFVRVLMVE
jgi:hypothetical protein